MKIFGWASDHAGCGQYRIGLPMWGLTAFGHDTLAFSVLNMEVPADVDVLVGQRIALAASAEKWLDLAGRGDRHFAMVYELDDDLWSIHPSNAGAEPLSRPEVLANAARCIAAADAVTVTTGHLAGVVSKYNSNVHVLPNCIDRSWLGIERPRTKRLTVGWAGGSSHDVDFASVRNELRTFLRRNPAVDTHFIGVNYGAAVGRPDTRATTWNAEIVDYLSGIDFDIGIAPLAAHRFNRSKSDVKFLEYATLGIPVVASDYGPYRESIEHGVTGLLVKYPHEWGKYLRELVNDEDMRREIGDNARRWAATRTIQDTAWRWWAAYESALAARSASPAPTRLEPAV